MRPLTTGLLAVGAVVVLAAVALAPEWRLPGPGHQLGWRSTSMIQFDPSRAEAAQFKGAPPPLPHGPSDPRPAKVAYKNVRVLTELDAGEFMRTMAAMTQWVSPGQGCDFCHSGTDFASDAKPAKAVARVMLQMTRHINADWRDHVGPAGVTCYSCHQGQPMPSDVWFAAPAVPQRPMIDRQEDYHEDEKTVRKFFPDEGYEEYLLQATPGASQSYTALPTHSVASQIVIKRLYEAMMQMSDGMGVNCGYCHNSRAFFDWGQSTPNRWTGYSGILMTRDLNRNYLLGTGALLPQSRFRLDKATAWNLAPDQAGRMPGNGLANCATCHHGRPQPLGGASTASAYPGLSAQAQNQAQTQAQNQAQAGPARSNPGPPSAPAATR
jgi:photosynthetic reaction center cytochrome c subunit